MMAALSIVIVIYLGIIILMIASMWKLFTKAGKPGWACIVPIYSTLVMLEIINKPWYWLLLMMIPGFGLIWAIWAINLFVKSYGKTTAYTIGVLLLPIIFLPMLAFSKSAQYVGYKEPINTLDGELIQQAAQTNPPASH